MRNIVYFIFACLLAVHLDRVTAVNNVRACYYGDWATGRPSPAGISVSRLDPDLCTHLIISFIKVGADNLLTYYAYSQRTGLNNAVKLKERNPSLKVLVAVGGWNHGGAPFYRMSQAKNGPALFANSAVALLKKHNLDGLDVDWEYPQGQKKAFSAVITALRRAFDAEKAKSNKKLLLTAAVTGNKHTAPYMYEYDVMGSALDYVFVMSYDFHGQWGSRTGHQSALRGDRNNFDVSSAALHYREKGIPQNKIVMGFPTYGRTFRLRSQADHGVGAPSISGNAVAGPYTREAGFLAYYEVCANYLAQGATYKWDSINKASYMYKNYTWVSFDSKQAYCHKLRWLKNNGFGGWMVWAIDLDDHANMCSEGHYPLMTYLKNNMNKILTESQCDSETLKPHPVPNPNIPTIAPVKPNPVNPDTGNTAGPVPEGFCSDKKDGLYVDPYDCSRFIHCHRRATFTKPCYPGLMFNPKENACDWPANVDCSRTITRPPGTTDPSGSVSPDSSSTTKSDKLTSVKVAATPDPTTAPTTSSTTARGPVFQIGFCSSKVDGYYPNVRDGCRTYYWCISTRTYNFYCPSGLLFDDLSDSCNWPELVTCHE